MVTPGQLLTAINASTRGSWLEGCFSIEDGTVYFRFDTDDNTAKENESEYYNIQEDLQLMGYQIVCPCIEHDCISGDIIKLID